MSVDTSDGHPVMDYREHLRTYDGFVRGTITAIISCAVILLLMVYFLV